MQTANDINRWKTVNNFLILGRDISKLMLVIHH
jgi:hypothetical protein